MVWKKYQKLFEEDEESSKPFRMPRIPQALLWISRMHFYDKTVGLGKMPCAYKGGGNIEVDFLGKICYFGENIIECIYIDCSDIPPNIESEQEGICFPFCRQVKITKSNLSSHICTFV
ncbi:hypothetical protein CDAR_109691 [Caerostris darwini]|uniref:Uncharacterized protein n=1 Tax=Caerostris darwini TaxID=1538125 RepID=A0AAV4SS68_9ARAC|nr:hypothetical protein CDAR_109691 [Caerostris darwini]